MTRWDLRDSMVHSYEYLQIQECKVRIWSAHQYQATEAGPEAKGSSGEVSLFKWPHNTVLWQGDVATIISCITNAIHWDGSLRLNRLTQPRSVFQFSQKNDLPTIKQSDPTPNQVLKHSPCWLSQWRIIYLQVTFYLIKHHMHQHLLPSVIHKRLT